MHDGHEHHPNQHHDPSYFHALTPILYVSNFAVSMEYYVTKLGFQKRWEWGTPPTFGCVSRGEVNIFLCEGAQGKPGMWMSVFMKDVDPLYEEYKRSGAMIVHPPMNYPWNVREMLIGDPDGHRIRMSGEPHGPVDEGIERTETFGSPEP